MCSIYGAVGRTIDHEILNGIKRRARDRGRDGGNLQFFTNGYHVAALGHWRAAPTPELQNVPPQPYDGMVHNGTISNDVELGRRDDEIDSQWLARRINRHSIELLSSSLEMVKGSYALACWNGHSVLAAVNYRPLYYTNVNGTVYFASMARHFEGLLPFGVAPVQLRPYSAIDFMGQELFGISRVDRRKIVVVASAGMDSTVAAKKLQAEGYEIALLHFRYGCKAGSREEECLRRIAGALQVPSFVLPVDLSGNLGTDKSALFGNGDQISQGEHGAEYAHEWVPARNLVFASLAMAFAESHGYHGIALGINLEEAGAYPDNEEQFANLLNQVAPYAVRAHHAMRVLAPVGNLMKHEIVKLGLDINAPLEHTWSCYRDGDVPCGNCGSCFMRIEAFKRNNEVDPRMVCEARR